MNRLEVVAQPDAGFELSLIEHLVAEMRSHLGPEVRVHWDVVSEIPPAPSGKYHFTISDVPIDLTSLGKQG